MKLQTKDIAALFPDHSITLPPETEIAGVTQDTRKLKSGEIYVALRGENFNGHDFVGEAFQKGAAIALVDKGSAHGKNLVYCDDTVMALGKLAAFYRGKFTQPVIAITGSSGKTTTKEIMSHVLGQLGKVVATEGNLNNRIGVPLTIFSFTDDALFFVVEMGMSHAGEIASLTEMAKPTHGLITSVGRAHMEFFDGKIENIALAKGELFAGLTKDAVAIVNIDDPWIAKLPTAARRLSYGLAAGADVHAADITTEGSSTKFLLHHGKHIYHVTLPLMGLHQVRNALGVFATGISLDLPATRLIGGLESFVMNLNRGRMIRYKNLCIMDDTYNANPDSMRAAMETLGMSYPKLTRIAVLGGMLEMGPQGRQLHNEVGHQAKKSGFKKIYAYGALAENYLEGFGQKGTVYTDHGKMAADLIADLKSAGGDVAVLFKGSHDMHMENVLDAVLRGY